MSQPELGKYAISKPIDFENRLTLEESGDIVMVSHRHHPNEGQKWVVTPYSDGNYFIQNADLNFLAPTEVKKDALLTVTKQPFEWRFQQSGKPNQYHIVVPGGPVDGEELAVDLPISDHMVALRPLDVDDNKQAWLMDKEVN